MQTSTTNVAQLLATANQEVLAGQGVVKLSRVNLRSLLERQGHKLVSVTYQKLDNTTRVLTGRLGVRSYLNGGRNLVEASDRPYLTMFDIQLRQYRTVNLSTVTRVRAGGVEFDVVD